VRRSAPQSGRPRKVREAPLALQYEWRVFDAFLAIYQVAHRDLLAHSNAGTGVCLRGDINPDRVDRLAVRGASCDRQRPPPCASAPSNMPPVDVTFGDYLRAMITDDRDLSPGREPSDISSPTSRTSRRRGNLSPGCTPCRRRALWQAPQDARRYAPGDVAGHSTGLRGTAAHGWSPRATGK